MSGYLEMEKLRKLDVKELLKYFTANRHRWNSPCNESFLKKRLLSKYPEIENQKNEWEAWQCFFQRFIHYIVLMKENYNYHYSFGDFMKQFSILVANKELNDILKNSSERGELALVIWSLKNGADIHFQNDMSLRFASQKGYLEIVKYLIEKGADIYAENENALKEAIKKGHLEIVKYLTKSGGDIHLI